MKLITGNANRELAQAVANALNSSVTECDVKRFPDMEIFVQVQENVRCQDIYVIQSISYPANDHLMELLIIMDALKRASARGITAVIPYFGYARQDRKSHPRTPISAKLVADLMTVAGASRIMTLDLHVGQIQGFFNIPVDNLFSMPVFQRDILANCALDDLVIVSPDVGGVVRARMLAERLGVDLAIVDKRRERASVSEVMNVIGEVQGKRCILVDDIIDSGGTLCNAAGALRERGAKSVMAYVTHGVLSNNACERVQASQLEALVITNSITPTAAVKATEKIRLLDIAPLLATAISRTVEGQSVSSLFD